MGVVNPQQNTQPLPVNRPPGAAGAQGASTQDAAVTDQTAPANDAQATTQSATEPVPPLAGGNNTTDLLPLDANFIAQINASFQPNGTAAAATAGNAGAAKEGDAATDAAGDAGTTAPAETSPTPVTPPPVTAAPTAVEMAKSVIQQSTQVIAVQQVAYSEPPKQSINTGNAISETEDLRLQASIQASQVLNDVSLTTHNAVARAGVTGNAGGALSSIRSVAGGASSQNVNSLIQTSTSNIHRAQTNANNRIQNAGRSFTAVANDMAAMAEFYAQQASIGDAANNAWISEQFASLALSAARSSENAVSAEQAQAENEINQLVASSQGQISAMLAYEEANRPANGQPSTVGQVGLGNPFLNNANALGVGGQAAVGGPVGQPHNTFGGGLRITA